MYIPKGTPEQDHLRALCGYLGAPLGASHAALVEKEAMPFLGKVPTDALTLEIVVISGRPALLEELERQHGPQIYDLEKPEDHRLWNTLTRHRMPPEVEGRLARGVVARNISKMTTQEKTLLARVAALRFLPRLLEAILGSPSISDEDCLLLLGDAQILNSYGFKSCAGKISPRLTRAKISKENRIFLTQRHHDAIHLKGLAILAKSGNAITLEPDYTTNRMSDLARRVLACQSSNHGRLHLMQGLPSLESLIATPAEQINDLLEAALPPD